jgi:DNA primase
MAGPLKLDISGHELAVTHPDKVVFPAQDGHPARTKLDLIQYYLAVADGALRGVADRPMILKRFVKGLHEEAIFQKRAPEKRPDWIDVAELKYASGTSAKEAVIRCAPATSTTPTSCGSISTRCQAWCGNRSSTSRWWSARCWPTTG